MAENQNTKLASLWKKEITKKDGTKTTLASGRIDVSQLPKGVNEVPVSLFPAKRTTDRSPHYILVVDEYALNKQRSETKQTQPKAAPARRPAPQPVEEDAGLL